MSGGLQRVRLPAVAGVLFPLVLSSEVAALSMSASTLIVALNALMLKHSKLTDIGPEGAEALPAPAFAPAVMTS